LEKTCPYLERK